LSLRKLGELSGVHYVSLARLEAGHGDPQLSTLLKLCQALNITLNQLVGMAERPQKGR
jgi:transcriptional regulator with XRE-family HTH domain